MRRPVLDQQGFTIVEVLLATAILVTVTAATFSALFVFVREYKAMTAFTARVQELRSALKQVSDDLTNAQYFGPDPYYDVTVIAYQPVVLNDWGAGLEAWPGDLTDWPTVYVSYAIRNGNLMRDVSDYAGLKSTRVVIANLDAGSSLQVDISNPKIIHLTLGKGAGGGTRSAKVQTDFYLR